MNIIRQGPTFQEWFKYICEVSVHKRPSFNLYIIECQVRYMISQTCIHKTHYLFLFAHVFYGTTPGHAHLICHAQIYPVCNRFWTKISPVCTCHTLQTGRQSMQSNSLKFLYLLPCVNTLYLLFVKSLQRYPTPSLQS